MHRIIKLIFSVIAAISLVIISAPYAISISGLDKRIAGYVVDQLSEGDDQIIQIGDVDLNYQALRLSDIRFFSNSSHLNLVLNDLRVEYNIFTLLTHTDRPQLAVTKIYFIEPDITYRESELGSSEDSEKSGSAIRIDNIFNQFEHIDRIHIQDGRINYKHDSGTLLTLASNLNGWFFGGDSTNLRLHAIGSLLNSEEHNFNLDCTFDPLTSQLTNRMELKSFDLRSTRFVLQDTSFSFYEGQISGFLDLTVGSFNRDSVLVDGNLVVQNGRARIYGIDMYDIQMGISVTDNRLEISEATMRNDSSHLVMSGIISNILEPELEGKLYSPDLNVAHLSDLLVLPALSGAQFSLRTEFMAGKEGFKLNGTLGSPKLILETQEVNDFLAQFSMKNKTLTIDALTFETLTFNFFSNIRFDLDSGDFDGNCFATRLQGENIILDRISNAEQSMFLEFTGNIPEMHYAGEWSYQITRAADTIISVEGNSTLEDNDFKFSNYQKEDDGFVINLRINDILSNPSISYGYLHNPPTHQLTSHEWLVDFARNNLVEAIISGPLNDLHFQVSTQNRKNPKRIFNFNAHVVNLLLPEKQIEGSLTFNDLESQYVFNVNGTQIRGTINSNASMTGTVDIDFNREEQVRSLFQFTGLRVNKLFTDSVFNDEALISGNISISGDPRDLAYQVQLQGDRFIINDVGYYRFDVMIDKNREKMVIDTLRAMLNNQTVLQGSGAIDLKNKTLDINAGGEGIEAEDMYRTVIAGENLLKGTADYSFSMKGPLASPEIKSKVRIRDGELAAIAFDEIDLALSDSLVGDNFFDSRNHLVNLNNLLALKAGLYHIEAAGNFPLYENGQIDLSIAFDGDAFYFLPKADKVFADGACFSTIRLKVIGTPDNPRITDGLINIERGELWLNSVAEHIQNISGRIELVPGSNLVKIRDFHGEVDGRVLVINTVENVTTSDGKKLQSWYFKNFDLDFGILAMETPEEGIRIHIPDFMLENELGNIALRGKTPAEKFYFAGPVKKPYAWGKAIYSDSRFTFPLTAEENAEPTPVVEFLRAVYWDVDIYAGTDVEYVRSIPAFLGRVDTELSVDTAEDGLHLEGTISNKTFRAEGELFSGRGRVDYLDLNFRVENFGVRFNSNEEKPEVFGRAWTTVRDSVGAIPKTIYLELYALDRETGEEIKRSRWEDFRFRLVSADPTIGETQEQVLAYLGYSVDNIKEKATEVGSAVTDNYIIRPLLRPIERRLESYFGVDLVRFNSGIAKNLFQASFGQTARKNDYYGTAVYEDNFLPYALLLESSELTVGKYLAKDLYLTYTGQIVATGLENQNQFNFNHMIGLEYRFYQNLLVEFEYYRETLQFNNIYTEKSYLEDFKIRLRHSFAF